MFTSFKHLPIHRHKSELNPIKGMVVYEMDTGNENEILRHGSKQGIPKYILRCKVTDEAKAITADKFWNLYTTQKSNL